MASVTEHIETASGIIQKVTSDATYRKRMSDDPVACFEDAGLSIEPEHQETVKEMVQALFSQYDATTKYGLPMRTTQEQAAMVAPLSPDKLAAATAGINADDVTIGVNGWGVVVTLSHNAVDQLRDPATGVTALTGMLAAALALIPGGQIPGALVGLFTACLGAYAAWIVNCDQGKGVYLTWLWAQFACLCAYVYPTPTPVV